MSAPAAIPTSTQVVESAVINAPLSAVWHHIKREYTLGRRTCSENPSCFMMSQTLGLETLPTMLQLFKQTLYRTGLISQ